VVPPPAGKTQIPMTIPTLLMLPPRGGHSTAEMWMADARLAAARDLLARLKHVDQASPLYILAADAEDRHLLRGDADILTPSGVDEFSFGRELAERAPRSGMFAYFGGASAPLLTSEALRVIYQNMLDTQLPSALVNNKHSTDWMLLRDASILPSIAPSLPNDNALGWVLEYEAHQAVFGQSACAATRCDLDTPADVCIAAVHPQAGEHLKAFLRGHPVDLMTRCEAVQEVLRTPASSLALIGRTSAEAWQRLVRETQIWVRVYAEERGMVASGRLARGEVHSLLAASMDAMGMDAFLRELTCRVDAVLWDTRVWMAHHRSWPCDADRFAADLGWIDEIKDERLRQLTVAQRASTVPILCGGHGVVAGGLYALLEGAVHQPSR